MRRIISAQSCASVPPAPDWMSTIGVVGIQFAGKHAPEFETGQFLLADRKIARHLVDGLHVVFLDREVEQFTGIGEARAELIQCNDDAFELCTFLAERLCTIRIVPDVGLLEFAENFRQPFGFAVVVKDTPLTPSCVP